MSRLVACYIVYNEEKFVWASIKSIQNHVKRIVVVDGSPKGPSTDETPKEVYRAAAGCNTPIEYKTGTYKNKEQQRNAYLEGFTEGEWVFVVDGDEVYKPESLNFLNEKVEYSNSTNRYHAIEVGWIHFWNDLNHYMSRWDNFVSYRVNKWIPGCQYKVHNSLGTASIRSLDTNAIASHKYLRARKEIVCHHYGHVKDDDIIYNKLLFYARRGDFPHAADPRNDKACKRFARQWVETRGRTPGLKEFKGEHPKEIKDAFSLG